MAGAKDERVFRELHGAAEPAGHHPPVPPGRVIEGDDAGDQIDYPGIRGAMGLTGANVAGVPEGRPEVADGTLIAYTIPGVAFLNGTAAAWSTTSNRLSYFPMIVASTIVVDAIVVNVLDSLGTGGIRMGIYHADTDWQPLSLVVAAAEQALGSAGVKTLAISEALDVGRYLLALHAQNSWVNQLRQYEAYASLFGLSTGLGGANLFQQFYVSKTYAALASTGERWTTTATSATGFLYPLFLRVLTP